MGNANVSLPLTSLSIEAPLKAAFNKASDITRIVVLASPT